MKRWYLFYNQKNIKLQRFVGEIGDEKLQRPVEEILQQTVAEMENEKLQQPVREFQTA